MSNPATILGLSVLNQADRPAQGLLQGSLLNNRMAAQRASLESAALQQSLMQQQIMKAQQEQEAAKRRQQFQQGFLGTPPQALPAGQVGPPSPGTGALADNNISNEELMDFARQSILRGDYAGGVGVLNALKQSAPTIGSISVGGQLDPFYEQFQKDLSKDLIDKKTKATDAANAIRSTTAALDLLNQGMTTGRGANALNYMGGALNTVLGINLAPEARANAQAYGSLMASQTAQIIKQFGAGTGLSDADREYALKAAGGDIEMDEAAIRKVLEINARANYNIINSYNKDAAEVMKKGNIPYDIMIQSPQLPDFRKPRTADEIADELLMGAPMTGEVIR
jgi:hypothetical protein